MSTDYDTQEDLKLLYTSRYDELFSSKEKDEGYWGDKAQRSNSHSLLWTFKNQSLRFTTFSTEKRENYVKNPKMRSPENRYGVKYTSYFEAITIIYSDLHHCKKVEEYELTSTSIIYGLGRHNSVHQRPIITIVNICTI